MKAAEAEYKNLKVQLQSALLTEQAAAAAIQADYRQASLQAEADALLAKDGLVAEITQKVSRLRADELKSRAEMEQKRLEISSEAAEAQLAVQQARVERQRAAYRLRLSQVESLKVRAGVEGVLQQIPVEVGQRVAPGTNLARVAEPGRLKAEVRIAETQARDIQIGQAASIDTRNGIIPGKVSRIDPAVQNGTVTVDVALEGALPKGARPLRGPAGVRRRAEHGRDVPFGARRRRSEAGPDQAGSQLGEHGGDPGRPEGRRSSHPFGHVRLGRLRSRALELTHGCQPKRSWTDEWLEPDPDSP